MNLPSDGTNQLPRAGFDCIALKVIQKKIEKSGKFRPFYVGMKLSQDGDNEL